MNAGAAAGAELTLDGLTKNFGAAAAVADVSLRLAPGSFTALLGPSGCGKSTLLALIAGLLVPDGGSVFLDGHSQRAVAVERRPVGLVFQKPLLFPHLSVEANVAFGLRMRHARRSEIRTRVHEMLERVQLTPFATRRVGQLSGGQEQRVALARALVLEPRLLLLDEPLSQLDATLRSQMRTLVRDLTREARVTTLFVTHDQAEAVEVADHIALMLDGHLAGHAPAEVFYRRPPSLAAARFFEAINEIPGIVAAGCFRTPAGFATPTTRPDGDSVLVIRPEAIQLVGRAGPDTMTGRVCSARFAGTHLVVEVDVGSGHPLTAHLPVASRVEVGGRLTVRLPSAACTVLASSR